ncbi:MAG: transaldolase [Flavobacteriaceae bacterium]|jgi:transaldolase
MTKIFLDSGSPKHTKETLSHVYLDGQTTNPSLFAKHPKAQECLQDGVTCNNDDLLKIYKDIILEIYELIPEGDISVEVYADSTTSAQDMIDQAEVIKTWIPNPFIKLPITQEGLKAAHILSSEGVNINMTLCFSQEQAMAVHSATKGSTGKVFVSPFIGRLDDKGVRGIDLIEHILADYQKIDSHVSVLAASVRSLEHMQQIFELNTDIVTASKDLIVKWVQLEDNIEMTEEEQTAIEYKELEVHEDWTQYNISHELTDVGLQKFADDWNKLIKQ